MGYPPPLVLDESLQLNSVHDRFYFRLISIYTKLNSQKRNDFEKKNYDKVRVNMYINENNFKIFNYTF